MARRLGIDKVFMVLTVLAAIGILWRSYPHLSVPDLMPSDEYHNWIFVYWLVNYGKPLSFFYTPHLEFYLMYLVHLLTGLDVLTLCKFTNPVIGGLSVFPFYFFASKPLGKRKGLLASLLFTFSEPMFYRSCYFGSTETLGLFFMFTFLGLYLRKKYVMLPTILRQML